MKPKTPIYVTRPDLPPLEEFKSSLGQIWQSGILSNDGPFHKKLEAALRDYLGVAQISLFSNGTTALMAALRALEIEGEVVTTPFSFVATAHSLLWIGAKPVFVDISPESLNIDPDKIEAAITSRTSAILPVHCFGRPCETDRIQEIARRHDLKVIYDAAHAFGVQCNGNSVLNRGDVSVLSFHATKVFNTFEGGAVVTHDGTLKSRVDRIRNFGFDGKGGVIDIGINGKMSEVCAALGLLQLDRVDRAISSRHEVDAFYRNAFSAVRGVHCVTTAPGCTANHGYFPIRIGADYPMTRDELLQKLESNEVYARRYFHPLISDMPMYRHLPSAQAANLSNAQAAASQVLCLPIYPGLNPKDQAFIANLIRDVR